MKIEKQVISINIPVELNEKLSTLAREANVNKSRVVSDIIRNHFFAVELFGVEDKSE